MSTTLIGQGGIVVGVGESAVTTTLVGSQQRVEIASPTSPTRRGILVPVVGASGKDGRDLHPDGQVPTYAQLPDDLDLDDKGQVWIAGNLIYLWDGTSWPDEADGAELQGPEGDAGRGITGISIDGNDLRFAMSVAPTPESVTVPALTAAASAASAAAGSASAAAGSAGAASSSASAAAGSASDAAGSASAAADSASDAATSETNAAGSASTASSSASSAAGSAGAAATSASNASTSASNAASSASGASTSASNAAGSASAAAGSASNAAGSASDAAESAEAAQESADDAADSATTASGHASAAGASATTASGAASAAAGSASAAAGSASTASAAKDDAEDAAGEAADSASAAAGSASGAAGSASAASGSASAASGSASAASSSATNASTSASNAATSASNASSSASNAATSAGNASDSADEAEYWAGQASEIVTGDLPNATTATAGVVKLSTTAGEIGGAYNHMTVNGWADKADLVSGKVPSSQLPAIALTETYVVADQAARLALTCQTGDVAVQTSTSESFILQGDDPSDAGDWVKLQTPAAPVSSVNSQTGTVVLGKSDVGLGNVDNTSDVNKPVSTATQTALDGKVPTSRTISSGTGLTGGGDLTANRTLSADFGTEAGKIAQGNDTRIVNAVQTSRTISTGDGLDGGGDLSANRTISVVFGDGAGEVCQGDDVRLSDARTPTTHTHTSAQISDAASAATASKVIIRDSNGRAQVANPSASDDIVNKGYLDFWGGVITAITQPKFVMGTTATAAGTAAKVLTITDYTPAAGDVLAVTFTSGNTAASHTLNINSGGAKTVWAGGVAPTALTGYAEAGGLLLYLYDGTRWHQLGAVRDTDSNTTYTEISEAEITTGTASDLRTITARRLKFALDAFDGTRIQDGTVMVAKLGSDVGPAMQTLIDASIATAQTVAIRTVTGTTDTLVLADQSKAIECTNGSATTVTVPPNASVAFPVGTVIEVAQCGAGQVTLAQGSGVTLDKRIGLKTAGQWATLTIRKRSTNGWIVGGDAVA